jgi:hypothetical protein
VLLCDGVAARPPDNAFDAALWLGVLGYGYSRFGQLGALAGHDAADEHDRGGRVPGELTLCLTPIPLC